MPSANPKLEKQASTEAVEPIRQAITVIEHKIRNLEKRKGRLEAIRDLQNQGKELNHDQKTAVAKYDEVEQNLELTRELCKQIVGIATEAARQQKKLARKEALERTQQDVAKVREVLLVQDCLAQMGVDAAREDFLAGTNGAAKITEEDLKCLDDLFSEVTPKHECREGDLPFLQQAQKAAEHFVAIVDGKSKEIAGTTYNRIKTLVNTIQQSGYFDQVQSVPEPVEEVTTTVAETHLGDAPSVEQNNEEYANNERHIPPPESMIPNPSFQVPAAAISVVPSSAPVGQITVVPQPIPHVAAGVEASYYTNAAAGFVAPPQAAVLPPAPRINDVIGTPNFYFLQESELDSPDVVTQAPVVTHIPPAVNAPIPSQTFTNQNFANPPTVIPQQVIYQAQQPQDMPHIPGFANPNPPPPIPMPPSHPTQPNVQYSPQHPAGFQQPNQAQGPQPVQVQPQPYDAAAIQEPQQQIPEEKNEQGRAESAPGEPEHDPVDDGGDWCQMADGAGGDWSQPDNSTQSSQLQDQQQQSTQQAWGDQKRGGYRGRGARRENSNGYSGRGRGGSGGYQQTGRGGGKGNYYRNNDSNYQNGYQPRNYNNEGSNGYNGGFKRGGGQRGGPRGERGMDRGGRGQFRGGPRDGSRGFTRGKPQAQQ